MSLNTYLFFDGKGTDMFGVQWMVNVELIGD